jgi:putative hemolysin
MSGSFLFFTILSIAVQGLFAFFEMACVSFNKVRLQYYVSMGTRRAIWIHYLLKSPSRLFGTTLIGITTSLVIGSECARRFYESIHLNPDWAPLTQVPLVVIFGELAPMFAARRHPEQSAMFCVPLMIVLARLLTPITWTFDTLSRLLHRAMKKEKEVPLFLSREEVRMAFEEREEGEDEFNAAVTQIFQLKNLTAGQLMMPLVKVQMVPSHSTLAEVRHLLSVQYVPMIPIYHRYTHNIVAIAQLRDLVCAKDSKKVIDLARSPWFVTRDTSILQLLQQFRRNNQSIAVILDPSGQACGLLTLDQILAEIFGEETAQPLAVEKAHHYIERTLSGEMSVSEFNKQFQSHLPEGKGDTLSDLILATLGHLPVKDETVRIDEFEFAVDEPTLRGVKIFSVRSVQE